jgi:hypothetical protein
MFLFRDDDRVEGIAILKHDPNIEYEEVNPYTPVKASKNMAR